MKKIIYRVQKGDDLSKICNTLSVPESIVIHLNHLDCEVQEFDLLYIELDEKRSIYTVKATDTIESISKRFCIDKDRILEINRVPYIYLGQRLYL